MTKFQNQAIYVVSAWKHFLCSGGTCFSGAANCCANCYPTGFLCQKSLTASTLRGINTHRLGSILFYMFFFFLFSALDKETTLHYWISSLNLAQAPGVLYISLNWDKSCNWGAMPNWICCWSRRIECNQYPHMLEKPSPLSSILYVRYNFEKP